MPTSPTLRRLVAVLALGAVCGLPAVGAIADPLVWKFRPGETFQWQLQINNVAIDGNSAKLSRINILNMRLEVLATSDSETKLKLTLDRLRMTTSQGENVMSDLDTSDPAKRDESLPRAELQLGQPLDSVVYEIEIDRFGRARKIKSLAGEPERKSGSLLVGVLDPVGFNLPFTGGWLALPDQELAPQESWTAETGDAWDPKVAALVPRFAYTLVGEETRDDIKLLRFEIGLPAEKSTAPIKSNDGTPSGQLEREGGTGFVLFDPAWGKMTRLEFQVTLRDTSPLEFAETPRSLAVSVVSELSPETAGQ